MNVKDRIKSYMARVKEIEDKANMPKVDAQAAKRFVKAALWQQAHESTSHLPENCGKINIFLFTLGASEPTEKKDDDAPPQKKVKCEEKTPSRQQQTSSKTPKSNSHKKRGKKKKSL